MLPIDTFGAVLAKMDGMQTDIGEIKTALQAVSAALQKLAVIEERQTSSAHALERTFNALGDLQKRVAKIEQDHASTRHVSRWVERAVWAGAAGAVTYMAKAAGLL